MKKIVPVIFLALSLTSCSQMKDNSNNSNNSNIKSDYSYEDKKDSSNVKKEDKAKEKYDDLSFIDCYKDIIDSKLPYRIDEFGEDTNQIFLNEITSDGPFILI
ncbi:MAG: hypothetical protein E7C03_02405 [Anaerococcus sp.]|nr:hypothetical protein [Anaerococcus sp.]